MVNMKFFFIYHEYMVASSRINDGTTILYTRMPISYRYC